LLTHPRNKVEKEYEVTLDRRWDPELAAKMLTGVFLDGKRARDWLRACTAANIAPAISICAAK